MRVCVFCKTRYAKGSGITFHKFPTDKTKKLWLKNMQMGDWTPKASDHICSKHFTEDCLLKYTSRTALKKDSIPTLFSGVVRPHIPCTQKEDIEGAEKLSSTDNIHKSSNQNADAEDETQVGSTDGVHESPIRTESITSGTEMKPAPYIKVKDLHCPFLPRTIFELCQNIMHDHSYLSSRCPSEKQLAHDKNEPLLSRSYSKGTSEKMLARVRKHLEKSQNRVKSLSKFVKTLKRNVSSLKKVISQLKKGRLNSV